MAGSMEVYGGMRKSLILMESPKDHILPNGIGFQKKSDDKADWSQVERSYIPENEHYPEYKMGNMICFITSYPLTCNPDDIIRNQEEMRERNWYCSDVMVRV